MLEDELTSQIIDKEAYKTELAKKYTTFLAQCTISGNFF